jgi:DNA-binding NtrC family response regulator
MRRVLDVVQRVAPSDANVLVRGENGTGKGLLAREIHARSRRAAKAIISVNIGGLSDSLFESELFGHVKGAFTDARQDRMGRFELADGGTLFLDEIANIGLTQQAKLLRVIESGEFERVGSSQTRRADVRLISATNAPLEQEVQAAKFRQDLLFRLNTVQIVIPPLRERREDIPPLASQFLARFAKRYRKDITGFHAAAMKAMLEHPWQGNVRELEHAVERAVLMSSAAQITRADLALESPVQASIDDMAIEDVEALLIRKALARFDGNVSRAAELLGLSRSALYRRIQRYSL